MSNYPFPNIVCNKSSVCDEFIRANINWNDNFNGISTPPLTIFTNTPLTDNQLADLTTLLNTYVDPVVYLSFAHTETLAMHSHFTSDTDNVIFDDKKVIQTIIFNSKNNNSTVVLDSLKTIVEYTCPNLQNYINATSGSILIEIYDLTRDISIASKTIDLNEIAVGFHTLAQTGSSQSNTRYRSVMFTGLMNKNPDYDCIWQIRGWKSDDNFDFRCSSLQYIYYSVE